MKLMQNRLFIDEIWGKIAVGTLGYRWNLILAVKSQIGSNLAIGSLYYRWNSNLAVGRDLGRQITLERGPIFRKKSTIYRRLIGVSDDFSLKSPIYR